MTAGARRAALVAVFFVVAAATIFRHEMWMDELNTWDVVRDATGLGSLFANMHLEVHPALWYLALFPLTRVTADPRSMQLLHLLILCLKLFLLGQYKIAKPLLDALLEANRSHLPRFFNRG